MQMHINRLIYMVNNNFKLYLQLSTFILYKQELKFIVRMR